MLKKFSSKDNVSNKLYIIGTPIGNIKDITYRAVETLKMVDKIYCEDTRITGLLLKELNIQKPLHSNNVMSEKDVTPLIIEDLKNGLNIGLVSDAGMPGISDPGFLAVREAKNNGFNTEIIPGVVAGITALVGSMLPTNHFLFYGFLNSKQSQRIKELNNLKDESNTIVFYEAPHRIKDTLCDIYNTLGNRNICLARELTKTYEEYIHGTVKEVLDMVDTLKGEMVIIVEGKTIDDIVSSLNELSTKDHYEFYLNQGLDSKDAMKSVAKDLGISKSIVYQELNKK